MTHYMRDGNAFQVAPEGAFDIHEFLPLGTYKVNYAEPFDRYFLEKIDDFEHEGKVYGRTIAQRDRILKSFNDRPSGTGVLLSGEKGSGKTLLAKLLAMEAQEKGTPTIVINQPWQGDSFNSFMQTIEQPAVVVFDEFEKVYSQEQQERLLTLLDGVYPSKKLFVLTCNDKWKVNEHMRNRPGRIFYRIDFGGLDVDFVREYVADNLVNQEHAESVVRVSAMFARFNFDVLKALVEEMNRFEEDAEAALEMLNAKPELGDALRYTIELTVEGVRVPESKIHNNAIWRGNPLQETVTVYYTRPLKQGETFAPKPWDDDEEGPSASAMFRPSDLKRVQIETGIYEFENREGVRAHLKELVDAKYNYSAAY